MNGFGGFDMSVNMKAISITSLTTCDYELSGTTSAIKRFWLTTSKTRTRI